MAFSNGTFFSANDFYRSVFGKKVYKVSVSSGCTCPNRDGTKGWGGCVFCSESGSGDFIKDSNAEIEVQLKKGIELISSKINEPAFIAYFQSFSNTYGDAKKLLALFKTALSIPGVVGLAIGTRPDCLGDETENRGDTESGNVNGRSAHSLRIATRNFVGNSPQNNRRRLSASAEWRGR